MTQYRKKPVTIEAVQFKGWNPTEIKDFVRENCEVEIYDNEVTPPIASIVIHTLEGDMEVSNGDYVIKGVKGEFYPCKPDIFEQTYESAETQKELEEAAKEFFPDFSDSITSKAAVEFMRDAFIAGADWQKEQDQETIELAEEHAMLAGRMQMKEQMMEEAAEGDVVKIFPEGVASIHYLAPAGIGEMAYFCSDNGLNIGDKVRIIIVKEEG